MNIHVIDSHTGGEPTRVVVSGGPDLGLGPLLERRERFRARFDAYRSATVNEPRGSDARVGALLCESHAPGCSAGVPATASWRSTTSQRPAIPERTWTT